MCRPSSTGTMVMLAPSSFRRRMGYLQATQFTDAAWRQRGLGRAQQLDVLELVGDNDEDALPAERVGRHGHGVVLLCASPLVPQAALGMAS